MAKREYAGHSPQHTFGIDAGMLLETHIFGGDEGVNQVLGQVFELDWSAVFVEILTQQNPICRIDFGSQLRARVFQRFQVGHAPEQVQKIATHRQHKQPQSQYTRSK